MSLNSNLPVVHIPLTRKSVIFFGHNKKPYTIPFYSVGLIAQLVLFPFQLTMPKTYVVSYQPK